MVNTFYKSMIQTNQENQENQKNQGLTILNPKEEQQIIINN